MGVGVWGGLKYKTLILAPYTVCKLTFWEASLPKKVEKQNFRPNAILSTIEFYLCQKNF